MSAKQKNKQAPTQTTTTTITTTTTAVAEEKNNNALTLCYLQFGIPIYRCRLLPSFRLLVSLLSFVPPFPSLCPSFFLSFLFVSWAFPPEPIPWLLIPFLLLLFISLLFFGSPLGVVLGYCLYLLL